MRRQGSRSLGKNGWDLFAAWDGYRGEGEMIHEELSRGER